MIRRSQLLSDPTDRLQGADLRQRASGVETVSARNTERSLQVDAGSRCLLCLLTLRLRRAVDRMVGGVRVLRLVDNWQVVLVRSGRGGLEQVGLPVGWEPVRVMSREECMHAHTLPTSSGARRSRCWPVDKGFRGAIMDEVSAAVAGGAWWATN